MELMVAGLLYLAFWEWGAEDRATGKGVARNFASVFF